MLLPSERPRRSPLREAHAELTRERIVHAVADLLRTLPLEAVPMRAVAEAAGISERTLYRYYADRQALRTGLVDWLDARLAPEPLEAAVEHADQLPDLVRAMFDRFDAVADVARASVLLAPAPGADTQDHVARTERIRSVLARSFPGLPDDDLRALVAVVRTLVSAQTWLRMRDEFGLDGHAAGEAVARALQSVLDAGGLTTGRARDSAGRASDAGPWATSGPHEHEKRPEGRRNDGNHDSDVRWPASGPQTSRPPLQ